MKNVVRVLCLLLACLFCLLTVVACDKDTGRRKNNTAVDVMVDENGVRWAFDEWGALRQYDNLPDELDYGGKAVKFLYWTGTDTVKPEFQQSEEVDNDRLSAIYKRNEAIMDRLGIEFTWFAEPGNAANLSNFVSRVQRAKDSETHDFDLIGSYSRTAGVLLSAGLIQNVSAIETNYIDTTMPWWPSNLSGNLSIKGNLYFLSGDISTNAIDQMSCIYFNKKLINNNLGQEAAEYFKNNPHVKTAETPDKKNPEGGNTASNMLYEKAYAGKWTLDDLLGLSANSYVDKRKDGATSDDIFGICSNNTNWTAVYGGSNLRMIEPTSDPTNYLKVSDDWASSKTLRLVEKLHSFISSPNYHTSNMTGVAYYTPFNYGNSYFVVYYMRMAEDHLLDNDKVESYGILPIPKYDLQQKNYYTVIGNEFSIYSIFSDFDTRGDEQGTLSMLSAVLECWASEAFRRTTPVIFELNMKLKSSPTQCEADMCEIIRQSIEVDLGRIFGSQLGGGGSTVFYMDTQMIQAAAYGSSWGSITDKYLEQIKTNLASFCATLANTLV